MASRQCLFVCQPITSAQRAGRSPDCTWHDRFEHAVMITRSGHEREQLPSPDHNNVSRLPVSGPENPYEPLTCDREDVIVRRESPQAETAVHRWLTQYSTLVPRILNN